MVARRPAERVSVVPPAWSLPLAMVACRGSLAKLLPQVQLFTGRIGHGYLLTRRDAQH